MGAPPEQFGPYRVFEELGAGGMATVHRAEVVDSDGNVRQIALKRMLPAIAMKPDLVKSFVREARIASYLRHPNVPATYELGQIGDIYYIAMELVTGRTLRDLLKHCAVTTGPMPVPCALAILNQICDALHYAHNLCDEAGKPLEVIHRDVSPSNVIVGTTGVVKLIDFGIAKASGTGMQTMSGTLKGKYGYMAPEYINGSIDARADLFAVGVIAHELLTNRPLFTVAEDYETLRRVRGMEIVPPSRKNAQVPREIDDVVMTALARDPAQRWQHATALRNVLTTLTQRLGLVARDIEVVEWIRWAFEQSPHDRADGSLTDADGALAASAGESMSIHYEPGTIVDAPRMEMLQRTATLMTSGAVPGYPSRPTPRPMAAVAPAGTPESMTAQRSIPPETDPMTGSFSDVVPTLVKASNPRMKAVDGEPASIGMLVDAPRATPLPPNRQSPVTLEPPVRSSGRLDERARVIRPSEPRPAPIPRPLEKSKSKARGPSTVSTVIWVLLTAAVVAAATYFVLPRVTG